MIVVELLLVVGLFLAGVWLSAFFSGAETAYYRLSVLRVSVEAQTGNRRAGNLLWFMRHPAEFVSTVLIGNNVANYVTTLAIGLGLAALVDQQSDATEIAMTLAVAPVVFLCGELVPKNVNYLTPMRSMTRKLRFFQFIFWIARPLSMPLVLLSRVLERTFGSSERTAAAVFGRPQVRDLLTEGRLQGVLTEKQVELTNRLLQIGTRSVRPMIKPMSFAFGLSEDATRLEALQHANSYGLTHIPLHRADDPTKWTGSVQMADLIEEDKPPKALSRRLVTIPANASRMSAIQAIRDSGGGFGLVVERGSGKPAPPKRGDASLDGDVLGFVSLQALVRPIFQDAPAIASLDSQTHSADRG